ncbi:exopolygalacturonase clone GBGE184-like [Juglans microcarpa x Juglans regia]|uniref:exopolygalacturonase clone GBGE184-like n=1 Tax=Juglans microcarpa x Juglans regia TaxID=2249226 RepID=UPI001B7EE6EC|nr:exopolygalacturonase clone GBGE184-like [Juglans microcarpa x Juglans regia]
MAVITERFQEKVAILALGLILALLSNFMAEATSRRGLVEGDSGVFDVTSYGAKGDGKTDDATAFVKAWVAACKSGGSAKLSIPKGTYMAGPVVFQGPCKGYMTVEVQGTIKGTTDISQYSSPEWFSFEHIDGLIVNGGGTFDGQGAAVWKYNDCKDNSNCQLLPSSIKFMEVKNAIVHEITSLNSKSFHTHVVNCDNFTAHDLTITAPGDSPNTDGMHISRSNLVSISNSQIGTGDDCVSIGQGATQVSIQNIACGPGHGISVGSLGKYKDEEDVSGISVTGCTLKGTTNGLRIKTWPGSPPSKASSIAFEDITMDSVKNPIIIDQNYGSNKKEPSQVKISNVRYTNIKGTSISPMAVSIVCSSDAPCTGIEMTDIDLKFVGESSKSDSVSSSCSNAKITFGGKQNPPACDV